jgi:hexose-6-phosphate dehydrogenase
MRVCTLALILSALLFLSNNAATDTSNDPSVNLIIIGSNGDLAMRKLWPSIRELIYKDSLDDVIRIHAAARVPVNVTTELLSEYFNKLDCDGMDTNDCTELNKKLQEIVRPIQLKHSIDYQSLHERIESDNRDRNVTEKTRIFYLSVPPFAYEGIIENIHSFARPSNIAAKLHVAIEKPFGRDLKSARNLVQTLQKYLKDDEVFLVDHYLHKPGVNDLLNFRQLNIDNLQYTWSNAYIDHIEIIATEMLTVEGRTKYYDNYGVIRDMLQSHLTELLALLTSTVTNTSSLNEAKFNILKGLHPPFINSAIIGQYAGYQEHLMNDIGSLNLNRSYTSTFSSVLLYLNSPEWLGVPIIMMSGKNLHKKETYIRVSFKNFLRIDLTADSRCKEEIVFMIENGKEHFIKIPTDDMFTAPNGWTIKLEERDDTCPVYILKPAESDRYNQTYSSVMKGLIDGRSDVFVPLVNVLESWRVWSPLIEEIEQEAGGKLFTYSSDLLSSAKFTVNGTNLIMKSPNIIDADWTNHYSYASSTVGSMDDLTVYSHPIYFLSRTRLARSIIDELYRIAIASINASNVFNIALPGGNSPNDIYQMLAVDFKYSFPWDKTHLWQTDERCVSPSSVDSNMLQISNKLLRYISLPHQNVHPLHFACSVSAVEEMDYGPNNGFDYVLVGVGSDGHIASLFDATTFSGSVQQVKLHHNHPVKVKDRVSLTFNKLIQSKNIHVIISGRDKCHITQVLTNSHLHDKQPTLPIIKLLKQAQPNSLKIWIEKNICNNNNN